MKKMNRKTVLDIVDKELDSRFQSMLHDISYRIECLYSANMNAMEGRLVRIMSRDLNIPVHQLDGYAVTDNSPGAGYIAWTDCNIVYKGTNYAIANGNSNKKYIYWLFSATDKTVFQTSDTKPTLTDDDVLVFINAGGVHQTVIGTGKMVSGASILDSSLTGKEIAAAAIGTTQLADGCVNSSILASGAVNAAALAAGAVTSGKIADGAISASTLFASGVVDASALKASAVTSAKLADDAVTNAKIAAGAVTASELADTSVTTAKLAGGAVTTAKLAASAVDSTILADSAVTANKIGAGAVAASKLNTALHLIY